MTINTELARQILVGFIRSEITRTGLKRAVLGLSGGIDSALACYLAAEALGPENVLAVRMPYRTSSQDSLDDAQAVIDATGVQALTLPITDMAEPLINTFPDMAPMRRGNIMARLRMVILYDQSAAFGGLVVGTGNKTEILLGYSTLYGDSACAINPLGDLYKTHVRQLSAALGVPKSILDKAPSADLWQGQTDEAELGFAYADVDRLLYLLVDQRCSPQDCVEMGFEAGFVAKVVERIRRNQFKRILPPIAKLSNRTIGYDFLYLRDWGT
ncbi:MAG TPA: NAD+ synthase [Anaerolineaceae bacterium]|nr:NAD+ synthase [Anaerolineaceae bacterium]HPN53818.1 NAD+ synthase [Anaerolineaceae bacterium]